MQSRQRLNINHWLLYNVCAPPVQQLGMSGTMWWKCKLPSNPNLRQRTKYVQLTTFLIEDRV